MFISRSKTIFTRFLLAFGLILLANLVLASALSYAQARKAVSDELRYQLGEAADRAISDYQRRQVSNLSNSDWAANTNFNAGNLSGILVSAYEPAEGTSLYDPKAGWSDPEAADILGDRAELVLAGQRVFWNTTERAYLAVPVRTSSSEWAILMLSLPRGTSAALLLTYGRPVILTLLAVSLPTLLLAFLFFHKITRPVSQMVKMAGAVAGGNFSQRAGYTADNEIGALGAALNQMAAQLSLADQARVLLISGISHDLRTPLTTIKANTQAMIDGIIPDNEKPLILQDTIAEIDRLRRLVDNLLLASGQNSKWPLHLKEQDLAGLVRRTISQMQIMAGQNDQTLEAELPESLPVLIDGQQIRQALVNLVDNAIRYSPAKSRIRISLRQDPDWVDLSVQDHGRGIPPDLQEKVFEPLVKGPHSTGSGLGLYLCRQIAEAHKGTIHLASDPSTGTCVTLRVPLH